MNKKQYAAYQQAVSVFFKTEGITVLSRRSACTENFFSWSPCDCCESSLGGNRLDASGWNPDTNEITDYIICENCEYYIEYGQLDDRTMLEIEQSS